MSTAPATRARQVAVLSLWSDDDMLYAERLMRALLSEPPVAWAAAMGPDAPWPTQLQVAVLMKTIAAVAGHFCDRTRAVTHDGPPPYATALREVFCAVFGEENADVYDETAPESDLVYGDFEAFGWQPCPDVSSDANVWLHVVTVAGPPVRTPYTAGEVAVVARRRRMFEAWHAVLRANEKGPEMAPRALGDGATTD